MSTPIPLPQHTFIRKPRHRLTPMGANMTTGTSTTMDTRMTMDTVTVMSTDPTMGMDTAEAAGRAGSTRSPMW